MVKFKYILNVVVTFVLVTALAISTNAANISSLSQTGDWEGGTLTKSLEITVTGDVDIKGPIIIPSGKKLTIKNFFFKKISERDVIYHPINITNANTSLTCNAKPGREMSNQKRQKEKHHIFTCSAFFIIEHLH